MDKRRYDPGEWSVVAVARDGVTGKALASLSTLGRFRSTPYRSVLVGAVGGGDSIAWAARTYAERPQAFAEVVRVVPLEATVAFARDDVTEALCEALQGAGPRLAGRTFHVRARLRGLKGRVETQALERALGDFLSERAAAAGQPATVRFDDPDLVVAVQVLGCQVGYALLDRAIRSLPLVRPR